MASTTETTEDAPPAVRVQDDAPPPPPPTLETGKKKKKEKEKESEKPRKQPASKLALGLGLLTHLLLVWPVVLVVSLGLRDLDRSPTFAWHPICMSLGAGLLVMEGVYAISGEALAIRRLSRGSRVRLHWIANGAGLVLLSLGLALVVLSKEEHGRPHFASFHSVLGLVTLALAWCVACFGLLANNARLLYPRVRPVLLKVVHGCGGVVASVLLLAAMLTGTYNGSWWPADAATSRALALASVVVAAVLVLVKPVIGVFARARVLSGSPGSPAKQPPEPSRGASPASV